MKIKFLKETKTRKSVKSMIYEIQNIEHHNIYIFLPIKYMHIKIKNKQHYS